MSPTSGSKASIFEFTPTYLTNEMFPHLRYADNCYEFEKEGAGKFLIGLNKIGGFTHIKIRREDDAPITDFYTFQQIKNMVLGEDAIAVQIYPKESELVDGSNTYHLWAWDGIEGEVPNLKNIPRYY